MNMTPDHYATLKAALKAALTAHPTMERIYTSRGLSPTRYRWDLLSLCTFGGPLVNWSRWSSRCLYPYLNDTHIDTAVARILRELAEESQKESV